MKMPIALILMDLTIVLVIADMKAMDSIAQVILQFFCKKYAACRTKKTTNELRSSWKIIDILKCIL